MRGTLCTDSRLYTCMASRDTNYNIVCVNVLHIFHCTAPGDNNYIAFFIRGTPRVVQGTTCTTTKGSPGPTSFSSLLVLKQTLPWSRESKGFVLNAIDALPHISLAHPSSPVAMVDSPWNMDTIPIQESVSLGLYLTALSCTMGAHVLCRHNQDTQENKCPLGRFHAFCTQFLRASPRELSLSCLQCLLFYVYVLHHLFPLSCLTFYTFFFVLPWIVPTPAPNPLTPPENYLHPSLYFRRNPS